MNLERYNIKNIKLKPIPAPTVEATNIPTPLDDETIQIRLKKILTAMENAKLDCIIIYEDLEHGGNFEYLTGFLTRFEEGLLVLHKDGTAYLLLGNENRKMAYFCRIPAKLIHTPQFSLPNQPMTGERPLRDLLRLANITKDKKVGLCGWKYFTFQDKKECFDVPHYIVEEIKEATGRLPVNSTDLLISPEMGARITNTANELAHYEFGASLSAACVENALSCLKAGKAEMEIGDKLDAFGQKHNVVTICATGERFEKANLYPSAKQVKTGDQISITTGFCGGLTSRAGYAVENAAQLSSGVGDYLDMVARPYYGAICAWLEHIHIGLSGGELYRIIEHVLPREKYNWYLNPGHLCAEEEWLCSPIYENSPYLLQSGMILQLDIIPSVKGYGGAGAENGIALADHQLQKELQVKYPDLWKRFMRRRKYIEEILHLKLHKEVLPMSDTVAYYRPFLLDRERALVLERL